MYCYCFFRKESIVIPFENVADMFPNAHKNSNFSDFIRQIVLYFYIVFHAKTEFFISMHHFSPTAQGFWYIMMNRQMR